MEDADHEFTISISSITLSIWSPNCFALRASLYRSDPVQRVMLAQALSSGSE